MRKRIEDISILTIVSFSFVFAVIILASVVFGAFDANKTEPAAPVAVQGTEGEDGNQSATPFQKQFSQVKAALFAPQIVTINVGGNTMRVAFRMTAPGSTNEEASADSSPAVTVLQGASPADAPQTTDNQPAPVVAGDNQVAALADNTNVTTNTNANTTNAPVSNANSAVMPESVMSALPDMGFDYTGLSLNQLNWCYPGQPWGNGFCNDPGLTPFEVERWWTCGWYWAHYDLEFIPVSGIPIWCGGDSDGDGVVDGDDACPADPLKSDPGICGCGALDTDSDSDGAPNCVDSCPVDPGKVAPGACGCGVADTDSDSDGTPDCSDACPADPLKIAFGACGCGVADTDSDSDGTPDCNDACPADPLKIAVGFCGCGVAETDSDFDGTPDCVDGCPADINKIAAGICGCGFSDFDADGDGVPDDGVPPICGDTCPGDPLKVAPGQCGCWSPDTDSDGDGTANCIDQCDFDPLKILPGLCGCGISDALWPFCFIIILP